MSSSDLPQLPVHMAGLPRYIAEHPDTPIVDILSTYRDYEAGLRSIYAQDRQNPLLKDPYVNVVPLFNDETRHITTRARNLDAESPEEKSRYIMALPDDKRRAHGSPATVANLEEFRKNFNVFSESSLVDLDWSNVVAAGSSVINTLLPVPKEFNTTKRKLREYYHEKFCPASDVDLFLYGLTHEEAVEKIKQIERAIKDAILSEVTVVRTKYAITIASQYPVRHVQIVLRVYKSISEILTGFDIDAAGGAYNGEQVFVTPRALGSFITQINHIDLTRRSPSYENRLSKYSHRNFEVYWPELDRTRVDPTIFERSFQRTLGLARLLILEALPTATAREKYLNQRREERGRPRVFRGFFGLGGNIKENHEDEVADWLSEEDLSNYHTFTVPYGQKFNAKRIEKLCYTRDLLLNAEWNQSDDRKVYLHRHPAFFGRVEDVIEDCCGHCPTPQTEEEIEVAEKEAEIYISGKVAFLIDDPGRQQIGSFNPLTEQDWTDMAYVGNTARLCQSIVDGDVEDVKNWLSQDGADPNTRDYTGRSPLHLAVMVSTPEVVSSLIEHGARLTARLADGKTPLHLAASRGEATMIKLLMEKSTENEEAEEEKKATKRKASQPTNASAHASSAADDSMDQEDGFQADSSNDEDLSDVEIVDYEESGVDTQSMATGSFIKVKAATETEKEDLALEEATDEPDFYNIDVLAWDVPCSPLHLAIAHGHEDAVKALCDFGADSILPVKFLNKDADRHNYDSQETAAILTLTLALSLPAYKARSMASLLLKLGATVSQADSTGRTAFQQYVAKAEQSVIDVVFEENQTGVKNAINHLLFQGYSWNSTSQSPLHVAIERGDSMLVLKMLNAGATPQVEFEAWLKAAKVSPLQSSQLSTLEENKKKFEKSLEQPLIAAIRAGNAEVATELLKRGADPNVMTSETAELMQNKYQRRYTKGKLALDVVRTLITQLGKLQAKKDKGKVLPRLRPGMDAFLQRFSAGTYQHWLVYDDVKSEKESFDSAMKNQEKEEDAQTRQVNEFSAQAVQDLTERLHGLESSLLAHDAKTFDEVYPDIKTGEDSSDVDYYSRNSDDDSKGKPYEFLFTFVGETDMTDKRRDGYVELMEAAWSGNLDRITDLTTQAWGPENDQAPLMASIRDPVNNTPFSLAFLRGHHQIAAAVLEIIKAQYSPPEQDKLRYKMESREHDDGSDEDESASSDDASDDEPRIVTEKLDSKYTIDDLGKVSMEVKPTEKPLESLTKRYMAFKLTDGPTVEREGVQDLFQFCISGEDNAGLKFLLDQVQAHNGDKFEGDLDADDGSEGFTFPHYAFLDAIQSGKTQALATIIKRTGAGIPLDHLVKKSGVELKQKPRYYQGLTVYGKKRNDWATAGRGIVTRTSVDRTAPLLHAAARGSMESVEFFLSDAPHRYYSEFGKSKAAREDPRLKHLINSPGGFDRAISKWLGADNDLVIHCAVTSNTSEGVAELLDYLTQTCPASLEKKDSNGNSPLMAACLLGNREAIKILIDANADQTTKNHKGENVVHALLTHAKCPRHLSSVLDLFQPELLRDHLFQQRKNLQENGTTPIHSWISFVSGETSYSDNGRRHYHSYDSQDGFHSKDHPSKKVAEMLELLLKYTSGKELELLNGAGDTPLHTAVMKNQPTIIRVLVKHCPELLYRENAVGRTPLEVALDRSTAQQFKKPATHYNHWRNNTVTVENLRDKIVEEKFAKAREEDVSNPVKAVWQQLGLSSEYSPREIEPLVAAFGLGEPVTVPKLASSNGNRMLLGSRPSSVTTQVLKKDRVKSAILDFCATAAVQNPGKRRLVSLNEANDVAKRLGERFVGSRYFTIQPRADGDEPNDNEDEDDEEKEKKKDDFAVLRLRQASEWRTYDERDLEHDGALKERLTKCNLCDGRWHE